MSGQGDLTSEDTTLPPAGLDAKSEPNTTKLQVVDDSEVKRETSEEEEEEEEEEAVISAHLEPSTLPWPGVQHKTPDHVKVSSAPQPKDEEMYRGSPDLPYPHKESSKHSKARWRESMPEGDRWRDDVIEVQQDEKRDCSLADDEAEDEEEETDGESMWIPEKAPLGFLANVKIVHPSYQEQPEECRVFLKREEEEELQMKPDLAAQCYPDQTEEDKHSE